MTTNQIAYWNLLENQRHNAAMEAETQRANVAKEAENYRHNVAGEQHNINVLAETGRANLVNESETARANQAREAENNRHNLAAEEHNVNVLGETTRANKAGEAIKYGQLNESIRSNLQNESIKRSEYEERFRNNMAIEGLRTAELVSLDAYRALELLVRNRTADSYDRYTSKWSPIVVTSKSENTNSSNYYNVLSNNSTNKDTGFTHSSNGSFSGGPVGSGATATGDGIHR